MAEVERGEEGAAMEAEEYRVWKKNTPFLYDIVISHALEWPSLTVQWLPSSSSSGGGGASHRFLLGTHTSDEAPNFLMVANVQFPLPPPPPPDAPIPKVEISQTIPHQGEVNRARFMPQRPSIVATKTCGAEVNVFDCSRLPTRPTEGEETEPDVVLRGHATEGYGLSWNPLKEGYLLSGSYDSKICLWDVGMPPREKVLDAKHVFEVKPLLQNYSIKDGYFVNVSNPARYSTKKRLLPEKPARGEETSSPREAHSGRRNLPVKRSPRGNSSNRWYRPVACGPRTGQQVDRLVRVGMSRNRKKAANILSWGIAYQTF
ncbi:hypothetical protein GW17_00028929 [Ensete ventricosum]|nr:hypothetical protein GW17_00028929 [Ensete ventricosum]